MGKKNGTVLHRKVNWYKTVFIVKFHSCFKNCVCVRICISVGISPHTYVYKCLPKNMWKNTISLLTTVFMEKRVELEKGMMKGDFHFIGYICIVL